MQIRKVIETHGRAPMLHADISNPKLKGLHQSVRRGMEFDSILCRFDALVQSVIYIEVFTNQGEDVGNTIKYVKGVKYHPVYL